MKETYSVQKAGAEINGKILEKIKAQRHALVLPYEETSSIIIFLLI